MLTDPQAVVHPLAKSVLETLQRLRRRAPVTTPTLLLSEAIEQLQIRVVLAARHRNKSARAIANLDALIERARPYGVLGLQTFIDDLQRDWENKTFVSEGRSDISDDAVELVTMHSAKGLEWPVVIPINTGTRFPSPPQFVHRRSDDTLHWILGGIEPPDLAAARAAEASSEASERERTWYVACTRARDLLILPLLPAGDSLSWSRIMDLGQAYLPELDLRRLPAPSLTASSIIKNAQTAERFAAEAQAVAAAVPPIKWRRPSDHDGDCPVIVKAPGASLSDSSEVALPPGAGRLRGILLHKLMEELLTGELADNEEAIVTRAQVLLDQLIAGAETTPPDPLEVTTIALRTLAMPEIAALRPRLVPDVSLWSRTDDDHLAGRADALAVENSEVTVVLDWKSDVNPTADERALYLGQLKEYKQAAGARRGAVVYMSLGEIAWL